MGTGPKSRWNKAVRKITPLEERDVIGIPTPESNILELSAINMNHILDTGELIFSDLNVLGHVVDLLSLGYHSRVKDTLIRTIDFDSDDSFANALRHIEEISTKQIFQSERLSTLLLKEHWTLEDRTMWEDNISQIVSYNLDSVQGLNQYRTNDKHRSMTTYFNDLSNDIDHDTATMEFDCDIMSVVEGSILQKIENTLLPKKDDLESDGNYKHATNLFVVPGTAWTGGSVPNKHALLVFSSTGNVIESTEQGNDKPYSRSLNPNNSFKDIIDGELVVPESGDYVFTTDRSASADDVRTQTEKIMGVARPRMEDRVIITREHITTPAHEEASSSAPPSSNNNLINRL